MECNPHVIATASATVCMKCDKLLALDEIRKALLDSTLPPIRPESSRWDKLALELARNFCGDEKRG
jgi:hypothetical protein